MPRTTLDLDGSVLRALKKRSKTEGKSLGRVASELLAGPLRDESRPLKPLRWTTVPMDPRVDLEDKEALRRALERE